MRSVLAGLVLAMGLGAAAQAATCTTLTSNVTFGLTNATQAFCYEKDQVPGAKGNDKQDIISSFSLFGLTDWRGSDANDDGFGDGIIEFTSGPGNGSKSGNWTIDTLAGLTHVVIVLKSSTNWGAFLLDLTVANPLTGTWASSKDLSHATIYYNRAAVVPLPAAGLMLLGALGGLGLMRRRRKAA